MSDIANITVFNEFDVRVVTVAVPENDIRVIKVNQGLPGRDGIDGDSVGQPPPIALAWNNVSPRVVYELPMDGFIISVLISITTAFNGTGASLSVGTPASPQLLADQSEINPAQIADFEISSSEFLSEGTEIIITTSPGASASAGAGFLVIKYIAI